MAKAPTPQKPKGTQAVIYHVRSGQALRVYASLRGARAAYTRMNLNILGGYAVMELSLWQALVRPRTDQFQLAKG